MTTRHVHPLRHALVCAALAAGVSVYASFATAEEASQVLIEYQAADLATEAGAQKLYSRLKTASRQVCVSHRGPHTEITSAYQACYSKALADAVANVNQQTLTNLHDRLDSKSAGVNRRAGKAAS
jgi:UrcA family protein